MRGVEHRGLVDTTRGEVVDVEEAAVVDFIASNSPVRETIRLRLQQCVQRIETVAERVERNPSEKSCRRLGSTMRRASPLLRSYLLDETLAELEHLRPAGRRQVVAEPAFA